MVDSVSFNITGLDSLLGKLENLKYETKKKGGRSALRKAAQLVRDAAKARASVIDDPGTRAEIQANIVERWSNRYNKATGDLMFRVGVMGGAGGSAPTEAFGNLPGKDTRHWRFVEFGREGIAARPFMRPALADNIGAATDKFVVEYGKAVDRAIKRAAKKGTVI